MSKTSEVVEPAVDEVLIVPESREGGRFHRPRFASVTWSVCNRYEPSHEDLVERVSITEAREDGFKACANCWPEFRADRVEEPEDDGIDRGDGIIADGGVERDLPAGVEVDHYSPDKFLVRCPSCDYEAYRRRRPREDTRLCLCGRSVGVTPVSETDGVPEFWQIRPVGASDEEVREAVEGVDLDERDVREDGAIGRSESHAFADGGYVGSTDEEVREAVEDVEDDGIDRGDGIVTDGGVDVEESIPRGWVTNHHTPSKWRVRCPSCEDVEVVDEVPKRETRRCRSCDRLQGVTPISLVPFDEREPFGPEPAPATEPEPEAVEVGRDELVPAVRRVPSSGIEAEWDDGEASEEFLASVTDGGVDRGDGPITDGGVDLLVRDVVDDNLAAVREAVLDGREAEALGTIDLLQEDVTIPESRLREFIRTGREPEALGTIDQLRADLRSEEWVPRPLAREEPTRARAARRAVADGGAVDE